ncbi:MAG: sulfate permease [Chlorobiales bacterium]|nr:sulfate permease [Chlorobiales bacterium]
MSSQLTPKLITVFREGYSREQFQADLVAGVVVGIVALPLAIAFAIASGVKPEQGLYTAIVAGITAAVLGGSRTQISGPTGAFIVVIYGIVQQYGYDGLAIATIIAGVLMVAMGFAKLGLLIKFIPYPLTVGFTSGIALIIFSSQIKDFFGLTIDKVPAEFLEKWAVYAEYLNTINPIALAVGTGSVFIIVISKKFTDRIPGPLIALVIATIVVEIFNLPVDTIGSRFGGVPNSLPTPHVPEISWALVREMISPAVTIAILGSIESLLSAVVADGMTGTKHRSNMELIAQGASNILSPIFGGIPATGAIARTATNVRNGGRTPVAAIVHTLVLLLIMIFFGQWAALIPMSTLAAILIVVSYNMSEWHRFVSIVRKSPKDDVSVLLITFFLTVLVDLTVAIEVGVVLSSFLFMKRMSDVSQAKLITNELSRYKEEENPDEYSLSTRKVPDGVIVFEVQGSLFFGVVDEFKETIRRVQKKPKVLILRTRNVLAIDASGLQAIEEVVQRTNREGTAFILSGPHSQPLIAMDNAGLIDLIGEKNIVPNIDVALERANQILTHGDSLSENQGTKPD